VTLFPAEPRIVAPWLLVVRVLPPEADVVHHVPFFAHSVRQVEEIATGFVERLEPGWVVTEGYLASSPVEIAPTPRRTPVRYRS
jgi:hypothetical protein